MKRITALMLAVVLCAVSFLSVGCSTNGGTGTNGSGMSSGGSKAIKLTVWGSADDQKMLTGMVNDFITSNSDKSYDISVRVNGEDVAKDEALKDIETAADVFAIANDQLGALVSADAVYENTKYADEVRSTRTESAITAASVGGKMYGYPSSSETYFLFYDKSKLTEDDVTSLEKILAKKQDSGTAPFAMDFGDAYFSSSFFMTAGCRVYGKDGQDSSSVDFNTEKGLEATKYLASLKAQGAEDIPGDSASSRFKAGKLASYISGSWKTESFKDALGDNFGVAKLPTINIGGEDRNMVSFAGGKMYVVKSTTAHPLEAMALASYLTSQENQLKRYEQRALLPNNKELAQHEEILSNPAIAAEIEQLKYSVATPAISQISKYWKPVEAFTKDAFDGKIAEKDMEQALNRLVSDVTA